MEYSTNLTYLLFFSCEKLPGDIVRHILSLAKIAFTCIKHIENFYRSLFFINEMRKFVHQELVLTKGT